MKKCQTDIKLSIPDLFKISPNSEKVFKHFLFIIFI